jgi:DNA-binding transcriptional MerR regulator
MTQRQSQVKLITIKEFAQLCRTTVRTIRFYDQKGLLKPVLVDEWTKYRYYSPYQAREYSRIKLFHNFKIPLKEVEESLKAKNKYEILDNRLTTLEKELEEKQNEYDFLKIVRMFLFGNASPDKFLHKETLGPYVLLCKLEEKGKYASIDKVIFELLDLAKKLKIPATEKTMTFYLDPLPYQPKDTRLEIGLICKGQKVPKMNLPEGYYFKIYPKTAAKVFDYIGPYEYISLIYHRFHRNRQNRILKPKEVGFDIYIDGPWNEQSENSYFTKICFNT